MNYDLLAGWPTRFLNSRASNGVCYVAENAFIIFKCIACNSDREERSSASNRRVRRDFNGDEYALHFMHTMHSAWMANEV